MIRFVPLANLPAGLQIPPELADKVSYEASSRRLGYRGFMCKGDFDRLARLSNDLEYLKAIEHLFQVCVFTEDEPPARRPIALMVAALSGVGAAIAGCAFWLLHR